jgi:hypothetical protein
MPELPGNPRTIRVVSDGSPRFTHVLLPDGGELKGVRGFTLNADVKDPFLTINLEIAPVELDINGNIGVIRLVCPVCGDETHHCRRL